MASNSCSFSYTTVANTSSSPPFKDRSTCCYKVGECVCSACLFSFCCPICMVWGCIKIPCKIGWSLAQQAKNGASSCGSQRRIYASYSSFSDMDSDDLVAKGNDSFKTTISPAKKRWKICFTSNV
ncbi:hypothetical protein ACH5RR_024939 [Cinchona calisaya]|uniref:Uncharacterized protein n=1 Tax=Cinchona calisaya TaxID=153742 RepID=A0ABD2Z2B5_9GENT